MHDPQGSRWWKWDLHVHTPASIEQEYGGNTDAAWEAFLTDLERLPQEFKVIGINDYLFLDGYRRVREARANGRLRNLDLVLPVIELRIDKFGGAGEKWSRVNFHVIFCDSLDPDDIEQQFLHRLDATYYLSEEYEATPVVWNGAPTRRNVMAFGEQVLASIPEGKRPTSSPLHMGFSSLNFPYDHVHNVLKGCQAFKNRHFTAVGRAEWDAMRWDQAAAEKKNLVNRAHFVFANSPNPAKCQSARGALATAKVNPRLLDCSDAHRFSTAPHTDRRIGKCWTWIKGDPVFHTLHHVYHEPEERIHLGDGPAVLERVASHPTKFIDTLKIDLADPDDDGEPWFADTELSFNPGLVAIIGNKGSGKSALLDILGLLGDSDRFGDASFLTPRRFAKPSERKAERFVARLTWRDGTSTARALNAKVEQGARPMVKFVPQNLFERICSDLDSVKGGVFDQELKQAIFSHVPEADRLSTATLDDLIAYKTDEVNTALADLRGELHEANERVVELQTLASPESRRRIETALAQKRAELAAHRAAKPTEPPKPDAPRPELAEVKRELADARAQAEESDEEIAKLAAEQATLARELAALRKVGQRLALFEQQAERARSDIAAELEPLGVDPTAVLQVSITRAPLEAAEDARRASKADVDAKLASGTPESRLDVREALRARIVTLQDALDEPNRLWEAYITALDAWNVREALLVGDADTPDTVAYLEAELASLDLLPARIVEASTARNEVAREILERKRTLLDELRQLYGPVQHFIDTHDLAKSFGLQFSVTLADAGFEDGFLARINQGRAGSFYGSDTGRECFRGIVGQPTPDGAPDPLDCANNVLDHLLADRRGSPAKPKAMRLSDQLAKGITEVELLDYLFGFDYLEPRYGLRLGTKDISQLSPGERGALLLVFYLLVDRDDTPLLIDQPEENLDNQTVFKLLVPSILEAKRRRQIFIVTHNPNLAVVCDAEQLVVACRDTVSSRIQYISGAIEYHETNRHAIDILEGTWPALKNRTAKYLV